VGRRNCVSAVHSKFCSGIVAGEGRQAGCNASRREYGHIAMRLYGLLILFFFAGIAVT
jgi:hypothetical protein